MNYFYENVYAYNVIVHVVRNRFGQVKTKKKCICLLTIKYLTKSIIFDQIENDVNRFSALKNLRKNQRYSYVLMPISTAGFNFAKLLSKDPEYIKKVVFNLKTLTFNLKRSVKSRITDIGH